jgi:hypothetical protein
VADSLSRGTRLGQFVPAGVPLLHVSHEDRIDPTRSDELLSAFRYRTDAQVAARRKVRRHPDRDRSARIIHSRRDGPQRGSCIDQLGRILIRWLSRAPPPSLLFDPPHVPRVFVPWISADGKNGATDMDFICG